MKKRIISLILMLAMLLPCMCISMPAHAIGDPYKRIYAYDFDAELSNANNLQIMNNRVGAFYNTHYLAFPDLDFGDVSPTFIEMEAGATAGYADTIVFRLDDPKKGMVIAEMSFEQLGFSVPCYVRDEIDIEITGVHTVYVSPKSSTLNFYNFRFIAPGTGGNAYDIYRPGTIYKGIEDADVASSAELLWQLAILNNSRGTEINADYPVSRALFANSIYGIYAEREQGALVAEEGSYVETGFSDVDGSGAYAEAIAFLSEYGIVKGNADGLFMPHQYVTGIDATVMLTRILGYSQLAEAYGGYPTGYIKAARDAGIVLPANISQPLKWSECVNLILSALEAKYLEMTAVSVPDKIRYEKADNILGVYRGIFRGEGKVTATSVSGTSLPETGLGKGKVEIDNIIYDVGTTPADSLLGYECEFYYEEASGKRILRAIAPAAGVEITEIKSTVDSPVGISDSEITYFPDESNKEKSVKIDRNTHVFYNGVIIEDDLSDVVQNIDSLTGSVVIAENNDGTTLVYVEEYEDYVIASIGEDADSISFDKNMGSISWTDDDTVVLRDSDGLDVLLEDVKIGTVITVYQSRNTVGNKAIRAFTSISEAEGTVTELSENLVYIDGKAYTASNNILRMPDLGTNGVYLLNIYGDIVKLSEQDTASWNIGLLMETATEQTGLQNSAYLRIITDEPREIILEAADKVTADGLRVKTVSDLLNGVSASGWVGLNNIPVETLVRYKLSSDGKLSAIDSPYTAAGNDEDILKCIFDGDSSKKFSYYKATGLVFSVSYRRNLMYMPPKSTVFAFYSDDEHTVSNLRVGSASSVITAAEKRPYGKFYSLTGKDDYTADVLVWGNASDAMSGRGHFVYESQRTGLNEEGEKVTILKGMLGARETSLIYDNSGEYIMTADTRNILDNLQKGDIIKVSTFSGTDIIYSAEVWCFSNGEDSRVCGSSTITPKVSKTTQYMYTTSSYRAAFGRIVAKGDGYIALDVGNDETTGEMLIEVANTAAASVVRADTDTTGTVLRKISLDNISVGDVAYVNISVGSCEDIVIYDDADV